MNEISVFYDHICQASVQTKRKKADIAAEIKEAGVSALEISADALFKERRETEHVLRHSGLKVGCVFAFYDWGNRFDLAEAKRQVELASCFGAKKILVVPGFLPDGDAAALSRVSDRYEETASFMERNVHIRNMAEALGEVVGCAAKAGVKVMLEDFDGMTAPYARMNQLLWFMKHVPGLCYAFDTGNFVYSDEDAREGLALLREYLVHVHCKDRGKEPGRAPGRINRGLRPVAVGEGYLPLEELVRSLVGTGYGGCFAIEHFDAPDQVGCMKLSCENLRRFLTCG